MKVFVAGFSHESSSFSPIPTSRRSFEEFDYYRPAGGVPDDRCQALVGYGAFVRSAIRAGHDVVASTSATAQPSAPCSWQGYVSLRDEILTDLQAAGPVDVVLLFLHGAQMAQGCDDCEGDFLEHVRGLVGPEVFVGALLDLHGNVTARMIQAATVVAACRNYPHTDFDTRAEHLFEVAMRTMQNGLRPVAQFVPVPMLGMFYTTEPRMANVNAAAAALEATAGVLSVSLIHGFPFSDSPHARAGVLVTTEGTRPDLDTQVRSLARQFFDVKEESLSRRQSIASVLARVEGAAEDPAGLPFVIADACDNAGGGAGSDATFILEEVLRRGLKGYAFGLFWDPVVVDFAIDAGVGAALQLRLGGKTGPLAGHPLDVEAVVLSVHRDLYQEGIGFRWPVGRAAALEIAGNRVIVCSVRGQIFSPSCFEDLGVVPSTVRAFVVKSSQHFHEQFAPISREVLYCDTPGSLSLKFDPSKYALLSRPIWPLDDVRM